MTRRARIRPDQVGLAPGKRRRVPGLRREEAALLAGISAEYYIQIERGNVAGVSDGVLRAVARALRLDEAETAYFFDLAGAGPRRATAGQGPVGASIPDGLRVLMDGMTASPAILLTGGLDILAANQLGRALYEPLFDTAAAPNFARFIFLGDRPERTFPQWSWTADEAVALLRAEAARCPGSPDLARLIGELSARSADFRERWAAHNVIEHKHGAKKFCHPEVGELTLAYHVLAVTAAPWLSLVCYTAEPSSPSERALRALSGVGRSAYPCP